MPANAWCAYILTMNNSKEILKKVSNQFWSDTFFIPVTGAEIEFYLHGNLPENIIDIIKQSCLDAKINLLDVIKEKGNGQYEITISHGISPYSTAENIEKTRIIVENIAENLGIKADFSAKPLDDDYGSAMQIHLSLLDKNGYNLFTRNGEEESEIMLAALGGLMRFMPESMKYFAPTKECYKRYGAAKKDAPSTISWGGNNRTVALRLPAITLQEHNRRIEHRVPSSEADPYAVIACILAAVNYGLSHRLLPSSPKIYGDASLPQYNLKTLPLSLQEANLLHDEYIDGYFI